MTNAFALLAGVVMQLELLPARLVPLDSDSGRKMLVESDASRDFVPLVSHFATQPSTTYCGVTSAVMVLNALAIEAPEVPEWAPFRAFTETNVFAAKDAGISAGSVAWGGATIEQLASLLSANHADVKEVFAETSSEVAFRREASAAVADGERYVLVDFLRRELGQDTGAHWSPIAAYHAPSDRFLVLDVARFRYPPYWVRTADLFRAMNTADVDSGRSRGWLVVSRAAGAPLPTRIHSSGHRLLTYAVLAAAAIFLVGGTLGGLGVWLRMRRRLATLTGSSSPTLALRSR